ncbi:magnesium/cobalt transporter CorA [Silvimonas sp. JCM 19000]
MLTAYGFVEGRLRPMPVEAAADLVRPDVVWVDVVDALEHERGWLNETFKLKLDDEEMEDIEDSARCYIDEAGIHLNSFFLHQRHDEAEVLTVTFLLTEGRLLSIRTDELAAFRLFRMRARMQADFVHSAEDILLAIYDVAVEYAADVLEGVYTGLDKVSSRVLTRSSEMSDKDMAETVSDIARQEDMNGKVRLDLMDTRRALSFLLRGRSLTHAQQDNLREVLRDLESLNNHTAFLFDKINFLMDAVMGLINLQQNKIIKIFSIAAVVFLPPTVIASIYGMNFNAMPELHWQLGYPFAIVLMILSGIAPYWFFKRKGWL